MPRHPLVPGVDVGADVAERMADVEPDTARVREHVEHEQLRAVRDRVEALAQRSLGVGSPEGVLGLPPVLPLGLDLVREAGVVPVRGGVVVVRHLRASVGDVARPGCAAPDNARHPTRSFMPGVVVPPPPYAASMCSVCRSNPDRRPPADTLEGPSGAVAQLVEHLHGMQGVVGSSPISSTSSCSSFRTTWLAVGFTLGGFVGGEGWLGTKQRSATFVATGAPRLQEPRLPCHRILTRSLSSSRASSPPRDRSSSRAPAARGFSSPSVSGRRRRGVPVPACVLRVRLRGRGRAATGRGGLTGSAAAISTPSVGSDLAPGIRGARS